MFLDVVTRTYRRPKALAACMASVERQSVSDYRHVILRDEIGVGVVQAGGMLAEYEPESEYVWVLDDDNLCVRRSLVDELRSVAYVMNAPAMIVRFQNGVELGVLPKRWGATPVEGDIDSASIVTRSDVWMEHRHAWDSGRYASDYDFIRSVFDAYGESIVWLDFVAAQTQAGRSVGRME